MCFRGFSTGRETIQKKILQLGNTISAFSQVRDEMNGPLSLEDSFGNLARIPPVFNKKKI